MVHPLLAHNSISSLESSHTPDLQRKTLSPVSKISFTISSSTYECCLLIYVCRYENMLPGVDIFVCTADPVIEPPLMVINTVLSMMAYDYPSEKLNIYVSDDGGSELTFYALLEASRFSKHWLPFCKRYKIEPRSPSAYFAYASPINNEWSFIKVGSQVPT